jgi:hypothetical protein
VQVEKALERVMGDEPAPVGSAWKN